MTIKSPSVHFIITGGTIDSYYDGTKDTAVPNKNSIIPEFIKNLKLHYETVFTKICMKDSRSLIKNDLKKILKTVEDSKCKHIIITHGTYTMPDTARLLKANLKRKDQTIVLTGSTIPMKNEALSDGQFNLGFSMAEVQILSPGIYVCMNGRIFKPEEVLKIIYAGKFESIHGIR